jgi:hypothetical protein
MAKKFDQPRKQMSPGARQQVDVEPVLSSREMRLIAEGLANEIWDIYKRAEGIRHRVIYNGKRETNIHELLTGASAALCEAYDNMKSVLLVAKDLPLHGDKGNT